MTQLWKDSKDIEFMKQTIGHRKLDTTSAYVNKLSDQERQNPINQLEQKNILSKEIEIDLNYWFSSLDFFQVSRLKKFHKEKYRKPENCNYDKIFNTFNTYYFLNIFMGFKSDFICFI